MKLIVEIDIGDHEDWQHSLGFFDANGRFILAGSVDVARRIQPGMKVSIANGFVEVDRTEESSFVFTLRGVEE